MTNSIKKQKDSSSKKSGMLSRFRKNNAGNFAIMAGAIIPIVSLGGLYGIDTYYRTMKTKKFNEYVRNACYRSTKPTRTQIMKDANRQATAQKLAEGSFPQNEYNNLSVVTTAGWLTGTVEANASFKPLVNLFGKAEVPVKASFTCKGIPPYPTDNEQMLKTEFTTKQGNALTLIKSFTPFKGTKRYKNCWQVYKGVSKIGWDGSHGWAIGTSTDRKPDKGGEIEVQFWGEHPKAGWSGCFSSGNPGGYPPLRRDAPSVYGIELDAYYNNEIWKDIELHPGHYQLSVWYFPRGYQPQKEDYAMYPNSPQKPAYWDEVTNGIGIYLEGLKGANPLRKTPAICVNGETSEGWLRRTYNFRVDEYNIYRLSAKAEQNNDSRGGIFNSLEVKYLDDLKSKKKFPGEYVLGESEFSNFDNCTDYLDDQYYKKAGG